MVSPYGMQSRHSSSMPDVATSTRPGSAMSPCGKQQSMFKGSQKWIDAVSELEPPSLFKSIFDTKADTERKKGVHDGQS
jgi:hypothetical protein